MKTKCLGQMAKRIEEHSIERYFQLVPSAFSLFFGKLGKFYLGKLVVLNH